MIPALEQKPVDIGRLESSLKDLGNMQAHPQEVIVYAATLRLMLADAWELIKENKRLKEGNFTPEELQNLCHNIKGGTREDFEAGCKVYTDKLFGPK